MDENTLKEKLGELYLSPRHTVKNDYIDAINKFINLVPKFKPISTKDFTDGRIKRYVESNDLKVLDWRYFTRTMKSKLRDGCYNGNRLEIVIDENNVKKIIVCRGYNGVPKEMSNSLSLDTIRLIYKTFVTDVVNPMSIVRDFKEIKSFFECVEYPFYIKRKVNQLSDSIIVVHNASYNIEKLLLNATVTQYDVFYSDNVINRMNNKNRITVSNIDTIKTIYMNKELIVDRDTVSDIICSTIKKRVDMLENLRDTYVSNLV